MRFYINQMHPNGGPGIFGLRLHAELTKMGHAFEDSGSVDLAVNIIEGKLRQNVNLLRLDGLYLNTAEDSASKNRPIFEALLNHAIDPVSGVVYQSEFARRVYEARLISHLTDPYYWEVIHNGVPREFIPEPMERREDLFITSASWRRHKRLEETIAAFADPRLKNKKLIVLGGQGYNLEPIYFDGLPENVHLLPKMPHTQIGQYYAQAKGMIFLSWLDACPNTVVEALACGTPVLCSHNGGTRELICGNGMIVQLEEDHQPHEDVDLYNPEPVDINKVVEGILALEQCESDFKRDDLVMDYVANRYLQMHRSIATQFEDLRHRY